MSLELAIKENTAAVESLAAYLKSFFASVSVSTGDRLTTYIDTAEPKAAKTETKTAKSEATPAPKANLTAETGAASAQVKTTDTKAEAVTYEQVKKAIVSYQQANGREKAIAALASLGVAKGTDLTPEQYAEALALFTA